MPMHIKSLTAEKPKTIKKTALLLGAGYTARHLVPHLLAKGYSVWGTTRSEQNREELLELEVNPIISKNWSDKTISSVFENADLILSSIPPQKSKDTHGFSDPVISSLRELKPRASWIGYYSATSVYGDRQGKWAFEGEPANPSLKRGVARAEAELEWLETGWPVHIFRLAGIYGVGRNPFQKLRERKARAVIKEGHVVNRIHVEDAVLATLASIERPNPQAIYNIADGNPVPPQDVLDYAANLLGTKSAKRVGLMDKNVSKMARSFYQETKRIDISKAKADLGWQPRYPSYKEGLKAIMDASIPVS